MILGLGLHVRCRYWSILQVVAIIVYYRGRVSSEIVKGCVGSQLNLSCAEKKIIQITTVALGVSDCSEASCCIKDRDCTHSSSESHTADVHRSCDNKDSCTVTVVQEKIPCAAWSWWWTDNNFESITYICVDHPQYIAQGCVGSRINLTCEETKVIHIISVVLGDSGCHGTSCCIKYSDCTRIANVNRRTDVRRKCYNEENCVVEVLQERIGCGFFGDYIWSNNDFERITYICLNETRNDTMNSTAEQESTEGDYNSDHKSEFAEGCVGTRLNLTCKEMKVINITAVIVGIYVGNACSIRPSSGCASYANENHTLDVHHRCNDRSNCTVDVLKEVIPCESELSSNNGVEHIRYDCVGSPQTKTTSAPSRPDATETDMQATQYSPENERTDDGMTSTDETFTRPNNNKEAYNEGNTERTTDQPNSYTLPVVVVIICLIIVLTVVVLFIVYRRKHRAQVKSFNPVAMTETGNQQDEANIHPDKCQTTSIHENENNVPLSVPLNEEDPPVYSEMIWKDDLSNSAAADEPKPAVQAPMTGPDVYTEVNKPSKTQATYLELETDRVGETGLVNMGDYFPDQIYSLASNDVADIYANEPAADSETIPLQDDDDQIVIENDLYHL